MIIQENENSYIMIAQHDHAEISGIIAENWALDYLPGVEFRKEFIEAVYQHDRGWVELDKFPFWNDAKGKPFSFIDFPVPSKLIHYKYGIDQLETNNPYGALLNSKHYSSLVGKSKEEITFYAEENKRQGRLKTRIKISSIEEEHLEEYFQILQFCDSLSLFICMYPPGTEKTYQNEKDGFHHAGIFRFTNGEDVTASWLDKNEIQITQSPFKDSFRAKLKYKEISKDDINIKGLAKAYESAPMLQHSFTFLS